MKTQLIIKSFCLATLIIFQGCSDKISKSTTANDLISVKESGWVVSGLDFQTYDIGHRHNLYLDKVSLLPNFGKHSGEDLSDLLMKEMPEVYAELINSLPSESKGRSLSSIYTPKVEEIMKGGLKVYFQNSHQTKNVSDFEIEQQKIFDNLLDIESLSIAMDGDMDHFFSGAAIKATHLDEYINDL